VPEVQMTSGAQAAWRWITESQADVELKGLSKKVTL